MKPTYPPFNAIKIWPTDKGWAAAYPDGTPEPVMAAVSNLLTVLTEQTRASANTRDLGESMKEVRFTHT